MALISFLIDIFKINWLFLEFFRHTSVVIIGLYGYVLMNLYVVHYKSVVVVSVPI
jgi:hypothetical protein